MYELVLEGHDADHDGKLSRDELEAMIASSLSADSRQGLDGAEMRDWLIEDYAAQDTDRDGYLSLTELLKEPLATFDCMDTNSDEIMSQSEIEAGMGHCGDGRAYLAP